MKFARVIHGELPFTLNLPDGNYPTPLDGAEYILSLRSGCISAALGRNNLLVDSPQWIAQELGDRLGTTYTWELRTIVSHRDEVDVDAADFTVPTEQDYPDNMRFHLLDSFPQWAMNPQGIEDEITRQLGVLTPDAQTRFDSDTAIRLTWEQRFPESGTECFCRALNQLVRLYMASFNDFFVEEVLPQHFSNGLFGGLQIAGYLDGRFISHVRDAGGRFPYLIRRPWFEQPAPQVADFRSRLERGGATDSVSLLGVRARAFLTRGVYRSAMTEASAALDLSVTRKIREGFRSKRKADADIDAKLKSRIRFKERAKELLDEATSTGAHTFDNTLWMDVCKHKENRQGVAHAAAEPTRQDAENTVEDMLRLATLISGITV